MTASVHVHEHKPSDAHDSCNDMILTQLIITTRCPFQMDLIFWNTTLLTAFLDGLIGAYQSLFEFIVGLDILHHVIS